MSARFITLELSEFEAGVLLTAIIGSTLSTGYTGEEWNALEDIKQDIVVQLQEE